MEMVLGRYGPLEVVLIIGTALALVYWLVPVRGLVRAMRLAEGTDRYFALRAVVLMAASRWVLGVSVFVLLLAIEGHAFAKAVLCMGLAASVAIDMASKAQLRQHVRSVHVGKAEVVRLRDVSKV